MEVLRAKVTFSEDVTLLKLFWLPSETEYSKRNEFAPKGKQIHWPPTLVERDY